MKLKSAAFAVILMCLFSSLTFGQKKNDNSAQKPLEVKVNLSVLDGEGKPAGGELKAEDLKIFEDGVEQKITSVVRKEPLNLSLVFDNTGSMRMQLDAIVSAGKSLVDMLQPNEEAFIIRFVDTEKTTVWEDWSADKMLLKKGIANMYIEGGQSAILDAVYLGTTKILTREKNDKSKRYALVLVTDGEERASYMNLQKTLELLKTSETQIYILTLVGNLAKETQKTASALSRRLALETGGTAFILKETTDEKLKTELDEALRSLKTELRSQYVVSYTSTNPKRDGKARTLRAEIALGEKRQAVIRNGFIVPKE